MAIPTPNHPPTPVATGTDVTIDGPSDLGAKIVKHLAEKHSPKEEELWKLDASKLKITRSEKKSSLPEDLKFVWGATFTDHMLVVHHDPARGWLEPEIRPYGPLELDPASACLHYAPALFEGMKAYRSAKPGSKPVLFRPDMNMARMRRSAARVRLPDFDADELIKLIKKLIEVDQHMIPPPPHALYIRPTMIGTRPTLGVAPSTHAMIYVILSPVGPFFPTKAPAPAPALPLANGTSISHTNGSSSELTETSASGATTHLAAGSDSVTYAAQFSPIGLLATTSATRSWPGGVGEFKLAGNYAPCFAPQQKALAKGYQQNLWCLDGRISEAGQMNMFVVLDKGDGKVEVATPRLDGTILPGVTRDSVLALLRKHAATSDEKLDGIPADWNLTVSERDITLQEIIDVVRAGKLLEVFGTGTAAILCPVNRIGLEDESPDLTTPSYTGGLGPVARGVYERISMIQQGDIEGHEWTVECL
ncbi:branched-chain-amino-acid transaminase bat2 [Naganishia albida]|nr:branched-chain-amino-acid transaminase bat2 [Naganishia albida]